MVEPALRPGRTPELAKFEILEEIGRGGMATVYRASDRRLGREVALKVIHPHLRDSTEVASRFHAEAKAVAKLRHPNIVEVYDVSESDEREQYLVAELVRGTTLRRLQQQRGPMPAEIAAIIALEVLDALAHANASGVVHRDVKPENVLIAHLPRDESSDRLAAEPSRLRVAVKLTDFGIAKLLDAQGVTSTGQVLGSPAHMAPEQIDGGDVDARSDVFGMGVLLYESMVGHLPFEGANPAQVLRRVLDGTYAPAHIERPLVGTRWSAILDRALAHEPKDRYPDAGAMHRDVLAELDRLDFPAARLCELQEWLDDQAAYERRYAELVPVRLRATADEARRRGDVLLAASDYNRALAFSPDDPALMRIVLGISRSEARSKLARQAGGVIAAALFLGAGAFVLGPAIERMIGLRDNAPNAIASAVPRPSPVARQGGGSTAVAAASVPNRSPAIAAESSPTPSVPLPRDAVTTGAPSAFGEPEIPRPPASVRASSSLTRTDRTLTLDLRPPMGVTLAVDDDGPRPVTTGEVLSLDTNSHVLLFGCGVCTPVRVLVPAGDRSEPLSVTVPVQPATLVIAGDPRATYQLSEHPELTVRAGANTLAIRSAFERVTVHEIETGAVVPVRLEAGKTVRAAFDMDH